MSRTLTVLFSRIFKFSFARFFVAGWPGTVLYFLTLHLLTRYFGRQDIFLWSLAASLVNYASNFFLEKWWVWKNPGRTELATQSFHYLLLFVAGTIANMALLQLIVLYTHLWYMVGPIVVGALITAMNYFGSRLILQKRPGTDS